MGNKLASCGCRTETTAKGNGYSPYSKQMSRNLVRFWAEVFLLAQEGQSVETKWQMVVPKLVPINVARVQDTPTVISHVTAYNTKVDKVMDTLIFYPGIEVYRGSECFIYWSDPQKGLTWGLNFITPDDASYFIDVVFGASGLMCRRANSTQSLAAKHHRSTKSRSTSSPGTPEANGSKKHSQGRQSVKFVETPTICETSPPSSSIELPKMSTSMPDAGSNFVRSDQSIPQESFHLSRSSPFQRPNLSSTSMSSAISANLDDGSSQIIVHLPSCIQGQNKIGLEQLDGGIGNACGASTPNRINGDSADAKQREREAIWKRLDSIAAATEALEPMRMSLDSSSLKKMLGPLQQQQSIVVNSQQLLSPQRLPNVGAGSPHPHTPQNSKLPDQSIDSSGKIKSMTSSVETRGIVDLGKTPATGNAIGDQCDVILRQNDRQVPVVLTPSLKRSSIHLVAGKSGRLTSATAGDLDLKGAHGEPTCSMNEDANSLSSSLDGSTTSQHAVPTSGATASPSTSKALSALKVRRAGKISMKQWITAKDKNIIILTNATWQQFWCCVKGYALHFYVISNQGESDVGRSRRNPKRDGIEEMKLSNEPTLVIDLLNCLAQAVPEYPRRQHVFCLSTGLGHVYLLQVTSETELDSWIQALHTFAALASIRNPNRDAAARSLKKEIEKMEEKMETVAKLIKLSQLPSVGTVSLHQVGDWESELEFLHLQHFVAKAYLASIKGQEMPSCKKVLSAATSSTKNYLSHLSAFTLSAMHAYIFAKSTPKLTLTSGTSSSKLSDPIPKKKLDQVLEAVDPPIEQGERKESQGSSSGSDIYSGFVDCTSTSRNAIFKSRASLVQITLPNNQVTVVSVTDMDSVATVLQKACDKAGLRSEKCFMLLRKVTTPGESYVPDDMELLQPKIATHQVEIRERLVYHVHLSRSETPDRIFGLTIRAQKQLVRGRLTVFVSNVDENGLAKRAGLQIGDELLAVNGQCVKTLNSQQIERLLQESQSLCLIMRTKRTALPVCLEPVNCDSSQESLRTFCGGGSNFCSMQSNLGGQQQLGLIDEDEEAENWFSDTCGLLNQQMDYHKVKYRNRSGLNIRGRQRYSLPVIPTDSIYAQLLQRESTSANASPRHLEQRYSLAGNLEKRISCSEPGDMSTSAVAAALRTSGKLGPSEKLEKVLFELVETDRAYAEDLENMVRTYLEPLRERQLLPADPMDRLITASLSIARFQRSFLEELQEAAGFEPNVNFSFPSPSHLRNALLRVGGVFLSMAARFRLYSSFCAAYFRIQKLIAAEEQNSQLQQFLVNCNVQRQHSATLESYLIKPVQRVLRYPLFLQQMKSLTSQGTPENLQISEALAKMEKVAEYINEMQRVYEEYGNVFTQIQVQCQQNREKLSLELSDLLMFGEVGWLNAGEDGGKKKMSNGSIDCVCFVFKSAIVLLILDKGKGKKNKNNQNSEKAPVFRLIPVSEIEINGSDVGSTENRFIWILIHIDPAQRTEKVYHFANRRKDIKLQFLRAIRKAGLLLSKENGANARQIRATSIRSISDDGVSKNGNVQICVEDEAELSSPDSGFPQIPNPTPTNGNGVALRANGAIGKMDLINRLPQQNCRPISYNSSQSDPGYGSNNETSKKDGFIQMNNNEANGVTNHVAR